MIKPRKYGNVKVVWNDIKFDSKAELAYYQKLLLLERAGKITKLGRQVAYELAPSVKFKGDKRAKPAMKLIVDFVYVDERGETILDDVKGMVTAVFRVKQHLMKSVHGLEVRIVK